MSRRLRFVLVVVFALALLVVGGLRVAAGRLEAALRDALGPRASIGALQLGLTGVEVQDLRIRGAAGSWPAADELTAQRVRLRPSLASLWTPGWHIARIEVDGGYLSLLRTRQGRLRVLPALLDRPAAAPGAQGSDGHDTAPRVRIGEVVLKDVAIDFFDASVRGPTHKLRFDSLQARVGPLDVPRFDDPTDIALQARLIGPQRSGQLSIDGTLTIATLDAKLKAAVHGVDLVALQPYLLKVNKAGVKQGTLDMTLQASVRAKKLHAPGHVTLTGLELASGGGTLATFAGVPRQAVLAAMQRNGHIDVSFTLAGRLDDPAFSINDSLATRVAGGLAETLGVSLSGVVEGVGSVIKGLLGR